MQPHVYGESSQRIVVRTCTTHTDREAGEDPNVTCGGFEVRLERTSAVGGSAGWVDYQHGLSPTVELQLQKVGTRWEGYEQVPYEGRGLKLLTVPLGSAFRLCAHDAFALLDALKRALHEAVAQGLLPPEEELYVDAPQDPESDGEQRELVALSERLDQDSRENRDAPTEDELFRALASINRLASSTRSAEPMRPAPVGADKSAEGGEKERKEHSRPESLEREADGE